MPTGDKSTEPIEIIPELKMVSDYSGATISEVLQYPIDYYKAVLRAAVIGRLNSTKDGREYLKKAKRLNTTSINEEDFSKFTGGENKWLSI